MAPQEVNFKFWLYKAVDIARFAPSSHNCQPWQIKLLSVNDGGGKFELQLNEKRVLKSLSSLNREMYLSCGIFFAFLLHILRLMGIKAKIQWRGEAEHLVLVECSMVSQPEYDKLAYWQSQIRARRTVRGRYQSPGISAELIQAIENENDLLRGKILIHRDSDKILSIAKLIKHYARLDFSKRHVWQETFSYIRFDEKVEWEDGFYFSNLFGNRPNWFRWVFRLGLHPFNYPLYTLFKIPALMARAFEKLINPKDYVMTLAVEDELPETLFSAGQALGRLSLVLQKINWVTHPISVLVQHNEARTQVANALGIQHPLIYVARLGHSSDLPRNSPRRTTESIII